MSEKCKHGFRSYKGQNVDFPSCFFCWAEERNEYRIDMSQLVTKQVEEEKKKLEQFDEKKHVEATIMLDKSLYEMSSRVRKLENKLRKICEILTTEE